MHVSLRPSTGDDCCIGCGWQHLALQGLMSRQSHLLSWLVPNYFSNNLPLVASLRAFPPFLAFASRVLSCDFSRLFEPTKHLSFLKLGLHACSR